MVFLLIYCSIYGGMHLYLFWKVMRACDKARWITLVTGIWCVLMVAAPILTRALEPRGVLWAARTLAFTGHTWLALIFWFCCLGLIAEVWNLAVRLAGMAKPAAGRLLIRPRPMLALSGAAILVATVWGLIEASQLRLVEVRLKSERLPADCKPIRLVHVTDLHLSLTVGKRHLKKVIALIEKAEPDIIVFTGDLVDLSYENSKDLAGLLAGLEAPMGKLASLGNHEFHSGLAGSLAFYEAAGLVVLRGESVVVGDRLRVAGVDYARRMRNTQDRNTDENAALSAMPLAASSSHRPITILLKHQPEVQETSLGRFDLQLSGHSHGGQIFPFQFVIRRRFPLGPGLHQLGQGSALYVSRGAGTWGPPMRLFAPPEVTLIIIQ